jgi:hypothetical protein
MWVNQGYAPISSTPILVTKSTTIPEDAYQHGTTLQIDTRTTQSLSDSGEHKLKRGLLLATTLLLVATVFGISFFSTSTRTAPQQWLSQSPEVVNLVDGDSIYIRMANGRYWRADENDRIVTSEFPWLQGSRFVLGWCDASLLHAQSPQIPFHSIKAFSFICFLS